LNITLNSLGPTNQGSQEKPLSKNQLKKQKEHESSQPRVVSLPQQAIAIEKADVDDDFYSK
jgi:hypothetical protein